MSNSQRKLTEIRTTFEEHLVANWKHTAIWFNNFSNDLKDANNETIKEWLAFKFERITITAGTSKSCRKYEGNFLITISIPADDGDQRAWDLADMFIDDFSFDRVVAGGKLRLEHATAIDGGSEKGIYRVNLFQNFIYF